MTSKYDPSTTPARTERFAEQLKQQREKREHSRMMEEWDDKRTYESQAIEARISDLRTQMRMLEIQLQAERHRFSLMNRFMRFFRRFPDRMTTSAALKIPPSFTSPFSLVPLQMYFVETGMNI